MIIPFAQPVAPVQVMTEFDAFIGLDGIKRASRWLVSLDDYERAVLRVGHW